MKILHLIFFLLQGIVTNCLSQNLILNGNFEDVNICKEFDAPCAPEAWRLTSAYLPQYIDNSGDHSVGIIVTNSSVKNVRSYLETRLIFNLSKGKHYKFTMDIMPGDIYINKIGVVLSDTIILSKSDILLNILPEFEFQNKKKFLAAKKKENWLTVEKEFTAKSESSYVIIGSFDTDENLTLKYKKGAYKSYKNYCYFIDNVSIIPLDTTYNTSTLSLIKNEIYSQDLRHPVPNEFLGKKIDSNPNDEQQFIKADTTILFGDLYFDFDSFIPSNKLLSRIDSIFMNNRSTIDSILIIGHADKIGTDEYNDELSLKRAKSIESYIISKNFFNQTEIRTIGLGSRFPITNNLLSSEFYKNRRVEIIKFNSAYN